MTRTAGYRLAPAAAADLSRILERSGRLFGMSQRRIYAALIQEAIRRVTENPERAGSVDRSSTEQGLRSYAVRLAGRRRSASPHQLIYQREGGGVLIVRILHEARDPTLHLGSADEA